MGKGENFLTTRQGLRAMEVASVQAFQSVGAEFAVHRQKIAVLEAVVLHGGFWARLRWLLRGAR